MKRAAKHHLYLVILAQVACLAAGLWMQHHFVISTTRTNAVEKTWKEMGEEADNILSRLSNNADSESVDAASNMEQLRLLFGSASPRAGGMCIVDGSWNVLFVKSDVGDSDENGVSVGNRLVWTPDEESTADTDRQIRGTFDARKGPYLAIGHGIKGWDGYLLVYCPRDAVEAMTSELLSSLPAISAVTLLWTSVLLSISTYMVLSLFHETAERERARSWNVGLQLRRVKDQASTDPLTGLRNRAGLETQLELLYQQQSVRNADLAAVMLDTDNFKAYNDTHGHMDGDALLRSIGALLRQSIRPADIAVRYGGDEFLLLLPGANAEQASVIAGRIVKLFSQQSGRLGQQDAVSMSAGVASLRGDGCDSGHALVHQADVALYEAKRNGKNMVSTSAKSGQRATTPISKPASVLS